MKYHVLMLSLIVLQSQKITDDHLFNFIIWDVGQGLWTTYLHQGDCLHFDMGGEKFPVKVIPLCGKKNNILFISHEDWDHVSFIGRFRRLVPNFCFFPLNRPKRRFLKNLKKCQGNIPKPVKIISTGLVGRSANEESSVFTIDNKVLLTGDAPKSEERRWAHKLPRRMKLLVLGHHGSNTSTSNSLIEHTQFKVAVASSRKKRYGHPHPKVVSRLKRKKTPVLSTERMRSLYFWIKY